MGDAVGPLTGKQRARGVRVRLLAGAGLAAICVIGCKSEPRRGPGDLPPGAAPVTSSLALVAPPVASGALPDKVAPLSFAPIARRADASVVTIYTVGDEERGALAPRRSRGRAAKGLGTGFLVTGDGVIVTNNHVIEGANEIVVKLSDERRFPGKVAARDPRTDVAVVRIEQAKDLTPIPLGDSDILEVGDWVLAIGNPFGLSHTVSAGIVSAKGRGRDDVPLDPSGYYNFLQTDASINPGNSGGPLLNLRGEVVGMNTAIRGGGAQGIGFAIPINMVKQLLPTLLREGHFTRSALGVRIVDVRELGVEDRAQYHLTAERGAFIASVEPGGPADRARLAAGDVIVGFDDQPIDRDTLLQWLASTAGVGKRVSLRVMRGEKTFDLDVTLGELRDVERKPVFQPRQPGENEDDPFGSP